jgi:hypothetical protein
VIRGREPRATAARLTDMGTFRGVWALLVLVTAASACAPPLDEDGDDDAGGPTADTARVVCGDERTEVRTPSIRVRPDGVHVRVENEAEADRSVFLRRDGEVGLLHHAPPGTSDVVSTEGPGSWEVTCVAFPSDADEDGEWLRLEVADPEGLWAPDAPDCEHPSGTVIDYFREPEGRPGDPVDLAAQDLPQEVPGWSPDDVLEPAGYPEAVPRLVRVVRDGDVVAVAEYPQGTEDGWYLTNILYCEDDVPSEPEPAA